MARKEKTKSKKKSKKSVLFDVHLKTIKQESVNPFDVKINRQKHNILGRKLTKHEVGKPLQSRAKAIKKRKETLLVEYKNLGKVNSLIDRRIGEYDKTLTSEQKQLRRLAKVRKYNLADSDEEELGPEELLTHAGQSLADSDNDGFSNDSDDDGRLAGNIIASEHFSGGVLPNRKIGNGADDGKPKSYTERMQEIFKKKNEEKLRKDILKEQMLTQREQLDEDFEKNMAEIRKHMLGAKERFEKEEQERGRELAKKINPVLLKFEKRGTPTNRLKSADDLAKEEKERLQRLEAERQKRMNGIVREEETISADALTTVSGDALGLSFGRGKKRVHESDNEEEGEEECDQRKEASHSDEEHDKVDEEDNDKNRGNSDDQDSASENDADEEDDDESEEDNDDLESDADEDAAEDIKKKSFTCDGREKTDKKDSADKKVSEVGNEFNRFEEKLSYYCESLTKTELTSAEALNEMTCQLVEMGVQSPVAAGQVICEMLERLNMVSCKSLPQIETLLFLKLIGRIFPTSDLRHSVTTPALLLMSKMLTQGFIKNCRDVASGLFLSTLFLEFVSLSKRLVPEAINFLCGVLYLAADRPSDLEHLVMVNFRSCGKCNPMKLMHTDSNIKISLPLNLREVLFSDAESDKLRVTCLALCLDLVVRYHRLYESLPAAEALFAPMKSFLERLHLHDYPKEVETLCDNLKAILAENVTYRPLVLAPKRPQPLKQFEPKVDDKFDGRKKLVGSREWKQQQLDMKKFKKMKKDAERELRKDQRVLQGHILKETLKKKMIKDQKVKRILSSLATQEGEWRSMKKGKKPAQ